MNSNIARRSITFDLSVVIVDIWIKFDRQLRLLWRQGEFGNADHLIIV